MLDVRHAGMNARALEAEGTCHRWADDKYKCASRTCDRPIIGRDGKPLGFNCNLPAGHLSVGGKCAQVFVAPGQGEYLERAKAVMCAQVAEPLGVTEAIALQWKDAVEESWQDEFPPKK